jgi:hypothetical protein
LSSHESKGVRPKNNIDFCLIIYKVMINRLPARSFLSGVRNEKTDVRGKAEEGGLGLLKELIVEACA